MNWRIYVLILPLLIGCEITVTTADWRAAERFCGYSNAPVLTVHPWSYSELVVTCENKETFTMDRSI